MMNNVMEQKGRDQFLWAAAAAAVTAETVVRSLGLTFITTLRSVMAPLASLPISVYTLQ